MDVNVPDPDKSTQKDVALLLDDMDLALKACLIDKDELKKLLNKE